MSAPDREFPGGEVSPEEALLVLVTVPDEKGDGALALALARELVESRLAAGVNVLGGAQSVYRWQGQVHAARERVLLAQVARRAFAAFCAALAARHPHVVPCILGLGVSSGHAPFVRWIAENSAPPDAQA